MRILYLGDVMGRSGRDAIASGLGPLREKLGAEFVIVNGENATSGMGISMPHAAAILEAGADCLTLGDHAFDQKDMLSGITKDNRIIRPINYAKACPGVGSRVFTTSRGRKVLVAQVLGQVFMKRAFDDPFGAIDQLLRANTLGAGVDAAIVDVHAEATSEKMAMGHWCDGRASLVVGSHTHVPTADAQVLPGGTGYQTDAGMCGDYDSVIGMQKGEPLRRFVTGMAKERFTPAKGKASLCGILVETEDKTGLAKSVQMVRSGGRLDTGEGG